MTLNKVQLIGRLGKDPEVRTVGTARVVSFTLATSERWRDKASGERKEKTEWHNISIWNEHLGKIAEQFLRKGKEVYLEGTLQTRKWDKDDITHYMTEVVLPRYGGDIKLIGSPRDGGPADTAEGKVQRGPALPPSPLDDIDDDIPF